MNPKFIPTERPNNIFYGDIFKINNKGCLIFGYGKTKACEIASDHDSSNDIARDFACLTKGETDNVYGHFELTVRAKDKPDPIKEREKIQYFLRMLDEEETKKLKAVNNIKKLDTLMKVEYKAFVAASSFNICFNSDSIVSSKPEGIPDTETDPNKRMKLFKDLTAHSNPHCFLVPWMESVKQKGKMIKENLVRFENEYKYVQ